jgi:sensor histidine kinase YesM
MLIQPHLENAIWHGLRYKEIKGFLKLSFFNTKKTIEIIIEDNGIGIKKSKELKTENQKLHKSIGLTNINERIALLNVLYHVSITCEINDNKNLEGTIIKLIIPQLTKI